MAILSKLLLNPKNWWQPEACGHGLAGMCLKIRLSLFRPPSCLEVRYTIFPLTRQQWVVPYSVHRPIHILLQSSIFHYWSWRCVYRCCLCHQDTEARDGCQWNPRMFCPWWLTENGNCVEQGNEDDEAEKKAKESAAKSAYERLQV
jgi:hypothetical protein